MIVNDNFLQWESQLKIKNGHISGLVYPIFKCYGWKFVAGALCQLVYIALQFANPQMLNLLITFVEEKQEAWKGYLYIILLAMISFLIGKKSIRPCKN